MINGLNFSENLRDDEQSIDISFNILDRIKNSTIHNEETLSDIFGINIDKLKNKNNLSHTDASKIINIYIKLQNYSHSV